MAIDEMTFLGKVVVKRGVNGGKFLQRFHPAKLLHNPLSSSEREVEVFCPIVLPAPHPTPIKIAQWTDGRRVATQLIGDYLLGPTVPLQSPLQESQSGIFVTLFRDAGFQDFPFVINRAPQISV